MKRQNAPNFEANLAELEKLVERMERGELSLEDSLRQFEQGIHLIRTCQHALQAAEQKIQLLTREAGGESLGPLDAPADDGCEEDED